MQQPHSANMDNQIRISIISERIEAFHLPNIESNQPIRKIFTPEFSANSSRREQRPSKALVTEPSDAVLLVWRHEG